MIKDQLQREKTLDITRSFIVQAPAGSGKTELLIQRYLAILSQVEEGPESIVAITFTKKAAQEMRTRILKALNLAQLQPEPEAPHQKKTWHLAKAALRRSEEKHWNLLENPNRLLIQTLDGFCSRLNRHLPLLSGLGGVPEIVQNARKYYEQAAEQVWLDCKDSLEWKASIKNLLWYMDNQLPRLKRLIADLLSCREQWLDYVGVSHDAQQLSEILQLHLNHLIEDNLAKNLEYFPEHLEKELLGLLDYVYSVKTTTGYSIEKIDTIPKSSTKDLVAWKQIARFLLTNEGTIRKRLDKTGGFPAKTEGETPEEKAFFEEKKGQMKTFLQELDSHPEWAAGLADILLLPDVAYPEIQQKVLVDLLTVLTLAVAELTVLFRKNGVVDFNQLLLGALNALGTSEQPTDLALSLDYRIQHILIDEFQDTSAGQYRLVERLIAGWMPADGRSLFLVGDPMQSIYRFRQAEVGLFLGAWQKGIASFPLEPIRLEVNFRSTDTVVNWINQHMDSVFPAFPDLGVGAVPFTPSTAFHENPNSSVHFYEETSTEMEAERVLSLVEAALLDPEQKEIAILVQTRRQLREILPLLQKKQIPYEAVEIDVLSKQAVVQDLLTLTRLLLHTEDRLAWLAFLRSPFCALNLAEITHIVRNSSDQSIWECLHLISDWNVFSAQSQWAVRRVIEVMNQNLSQRYRLPHSQWILQIWLALGGYHLYAEPASKKDASSFFHWLEGIEEELDYLSPVELEERLASLYATSDHTHARVKVMTMHKAKGLEFDTVILPGLHSSKRADDKKLLEWWERPREQGQIEVLVAPLQPPDAKEDPLYRYLYLQHQKAASLEAVRLLYVALTRAKRYLHLIGVLEKEENGETKAPTSGSLLAKVWDKLI